MDILFKLFPIIIGLSQIALGWILWSLRREFVTKKHCDTCQKEHVEKITKLESRSQHIEDTLQNLPSVQNMHKLSLQMEKMAGDVRSVTEILKRVEQKVNRQEDFLLDGVKKQ